MRSVILICAFVILTPPTVHAKWERISTSPESTRAIVVNRMGSLVGFTATQAAQAIFARAAGGAITTSPLAAQPEFYGYAHDAAGTQMCLAFVRAGTRRLVCYGVDGKPFTDAAMPVPMTSGALTDDGTLWVVDPSGTSGPRRAALIELRRIASGLVEQRRVVSPLCKPSDTDHDCSELELHPTAQHSLAVIPLLGRFDGAAFRYPSVSIWNVARGTMKTIALPSIAVPDEFRSQYRAVGRQPLRLIYRSAASTSGRVAVIPALPSDERRGVRRDQLWLYDGKKIWHRIPAPAPVNAVTFVGEQAVIVTEPGDILKWVP